MPARKKSLLGTLKSRKDDFPMVQAVRPEPLQVLLDWMAPGRLFKKRDREYFTTIGAIIFLLIVILLFLQQWLLIMVIIGLAFYGYIVSTVEPDQVNHKITNRGVVTGGKTYFWNQLGRFWFTKKYGQTALQIENMVGFPQRLIFLLGKTDQEKVEKILADYLLHEKPEKTWVDDASDWLSKRVPLETK